MKIVEDFIAEIKKFGATKVSKLSGVPLSTIWNWVCGRYVPTLNNAQKVANAMGLEFLIFEKLND